VDEFLVYGARVKHSELVRGRLRVSEPASGMHGAVGTVLVAALAAFVDERELGFAFMDNTGFALPGLPDTVRAPDVSFVRADQIPAEGFGPGFLRVAPDLAVEILSPDQSAWAMDEKLQDYFAAGTRLVWVIDPLRRTVAVHPHDAAPRWLGEGDALDGGDVLPGFAIPVARLFRRVAPRRP
jgi:Uma2 family endonuclease